MVKGFTLVEAVVVFVIAGLMVSFAMPSYAKYIERIRGKRAEMNLNTIYNMQKRYKLDNGAYYECATNPCPANYICPSPSCAINSINNDLGIFIVDPYFTYSIDKVDGTSGEYTVTVTRAAEGPCAGQTMIFKSSDKTVTRNCGLWYG